MTTQGVSAGEPPAATPSLLALQAAETDVFLLARVQALVPLSVVLAREGFAADGADVRSFVRVCPQVRAQVVRAREAFGA